MEHSGENKDDFWLNLSCRISGVTVKPTKHERPVQPLPPPQLTLPAPEEVKAEESSSSPSSSGSSYKHSDSESTGSAKQVKLTAEDQKKIQSIINTSGAGKSESEDDDDVDDYLDKLENDSD